MSHSDLRRLSNVTFLGLCVTESVAQHPPLLEQLSVFCRECIHTAEYLNFLYCSAKYLDAYVCV